MPIPLLVPVLLALGLAASSDAEEDGEPGWEIDIPDGVFSGLRVGEVMGFVDVDVERRIIKAFTCVSGTRVPRDQYEVRLSIDRKYVSSDLRDFFSPEALEKLRRKWFDGDYKIEHVENTLSSRLDAESYILRVEYTPEEFVSATIESTDRQSAVDLAMRWRLEFFDDQGSWSSNVPGLHNKTVGTQREKEDAICNLIRRWLYDREPAVVNVDRPPVETVELKALLGLPSVGIRIRFFAGEGPANLGARIHEHDLEFVGADEQGQQVWDLFLF